MALMTFGLGVIVVCGSLFLIGDLQVLRILITIAEGSFFFVVIIFNSSVLAIFGKSSISTYSVVAVIIMELITIPFVFADVWYCALGFLIGSFIGCLISSLAINRLFSKYEYHIFRLLLKS
jgi:hypothetical protein